MNVAYNEINTTDAAKMIGCSSSAIGLWCRKNKINYQDVSGAGSKYPRYLLKGDEVEYIRGLFKKYGKAKAMKHYDKNWNNLVQPYEECIEELQEYEEVAEPAYTLPLRDKLDNLEDITNRIRDIIERLDNIEAEKRQLCNEYKMLKAEIIEVL